MTDPYQAGPMGGKAGTGWDVEVTRWVWAPGAMGMNTLVIILPSARRG
ncbi:hypothetical protein [Kocuria massiliensis]|nr:hypothetical protein [Kocuria massiliensis]